MFLVLPGIIQLAIYPITKHETNPVVVYSKRCTDCCWMTISCINILPIMPHNAPAVFAFRVIIPNRKSPPRLPKMIPKILLNLKSASNLNGNLNCSKELEHYAS